jgi:dolichyl-diphosphooligosaccharide--protein glycosyltransferase
MSKHKKHVELLGQTQITPKKRLLEPKHVIFWTILILCLLISWYLRVGLQRDGLISDGKFVYPDVDAYYHLMQADYIYDNWPNVEMHSDLLYWPDGQVVGQRPLMDWIVATIAKFGGLTVDQVGFYLPPILFLLTLMLVLFIGWVVWNRWAGLISVGSLAVIQGEIFGRTSVGFIDQHVMEIFLMCAIVLFFILALRKHWAWSFGAGIALGMQYLNWAGAPVFTLIILIFTVIQSIIQRFRGESAKDITRISFVTLFMGLLVFIPFRYYESMYMLFYGCSVIVPMILEVLTKYTTKLKAYWYPIIIIGIGLLGLLMLHLIVPDVLYKSYQELTGLLGWVGASQVSLGNTISEVQPILFPYGDFTLDVVWGNFFGVALLGIIGIVVLCFNLQFKKERVFIIVWTLFILLITLLQRRYAYYLAVNLCLISGFIYWFLMDKIGWRKHTFKEKKKGMSEKYFHPAVGLIGVFLVVVTIIVPNYMISNRTSTQHPYAMTIAWQEALNYLRKQPNDLEWGVISWWDYGYWIAREAKQPVPCSPGGGNTDKVAKFFISQSTNDATIIASQLKAKYVVIDYLMVEKKFYAIPILAEVKDFNDDEYNNSILVRLYYSENGLEGYKEVFESSIKYDGQAQVKIYERYDIAQGCDCGK